MRFKSALAFCALLLSSVNSAQAVTSGKTLTYCNGCTELDQKQFALRELNSHLNVLVFDKANEKLTKWGLHQDSGGGGPQSGPGGFGDEGSTYAVKLPLNSDDIALKESIVDMRLAIKSLAEDPNTTYMTMRNTNFTSAVHAAESQAAFHRAVYYELSKDTKWAELQHAVTKYRQEMDDKVSISFYGFQFSTGPDNQTFFIEVTFEDGSKAKIEVDTKKDLEVNIYNAFKLVEARDGSDEPIALDRAALEAIAGVPASTYLADDVNLDILASYYARRFGAFIKNMCLASRVELYCRSERSSTNNDNTGSGRLTITCYKFNKSYCPQ